MAAEIALPKRRNTTDRRSWHGMAFIMEALVLLVFLIISITILMQLFSASRVHNEEAYALSYSIILASNEAERFTADPSKETTEYYAVDGDAIVGSDESNSEAFKVIRSVDPQKTASGTLYQAVITVEQGGVVVYEIDSARYVSGAGVSS